MGRTRTGSGPKDAVPIRRSQVPANEPLPAGGSGEPPDEPPLPRYSDRGRLGKGGMGQVRSIFDEKLQRPLAMKILDPRHEESELLRQRFLREARVTARLSHPGIVPIYDQGEDSKGRLWFTMRLVRGRTLRKVIDELHERVSDGAWPARDVGWTLHRVLDAFKRVCDAIAYAHSQGVVHRDLKPGNLMIGEFGEVQVMDWGIGKVTGEASGLHELLPLELSAEQGERLKTLPDADDVVRPTIVGDSQVGAGAPDDSKAGMTQHGDMLGTPGFMPPEQITGQPDRHGPWSDVYALGACLYSILRGRPPLQRSPMETVVKVTIGTIARVRDGLPNGHPAIPPSLGNLCDRAMAFEPEDRFPNAKALSDELGDYLAGAKRTEDARAMVRSAEALRPEMHRLWAEATGLREQATMQLRELPQGTPVEDKAPAWAVEDRAAALERQADAIETDWLQRTRSALETDPELHDAHESLADHYAERLIEAERAGDDPTARRAEAFLRTHARTERHRLVLEGSGALTLLTDPPGATVKLHRFTEWGRRLKPVFEEALGETPLVNIALGHGSFLLEIEAEGRQTVRYPVSIGRGEHWDGVPPGADEPLPIWLPGPGDLDDGEVYVPAGWFRSGDRLAQESLPERRIWVDAFALGRFPVTVDEYLAFLDDLLARGEVELAERRLPILRHSEHFSPVRVEGDRHVLRRHDEEAWSGDFPVHLLSWRDARDYVAWRSARDSRAYRLPDELEWEKAGRGVDGRAFPWGNQHDTGFANVLRSLPGDPRVVPVHAFETDESVYGARGMVGNVRDCCENVWTEEGPEVVDARLRVRSTPLDDPRIRSARGGGYYSEQTQLRLGARFAGLPDRRVIVLGFRLCRSLPQAGAPESSDRSPADLG